MAATPGYPRWVAVVSAFDAVAAGLLAVAGVYLLDPAAFDAGVYVEAGRYALPGGFFLYSAFVLLTASVAGYREEGRGLSALARMYAMGRVALVGVGMIDLALGATALFFTEPARPLAGLLVVPGILALVSIGFADAAKAGARAEAGAPTTTRDSGKTPGGGRLADHLRSGALVAIGNAFFVIYLGSGYLLYYLLDAVLIEDADLDLSRVVFLAVPNLFARLWPLALAIGGLMLILIPLIGIASAAAARAAQRARPDFERDLSAAEVAFVADCVMQVKDHIERNGYAARAARIGRTALFAFFAGAVVAMWAIIAIEDVAAFLHAPMGASPLLYTVDARTSMLFVLVAVVSWAFVPGAVAALASRRRGEAGALVLIGGGSDLSKIEAEIVKLVRGRKLSTAKPFVAADFLWSIGVGVSVLTLAWAAVAAAAVVVVWPHDRATDTLYAETGIETGDFWTMGRTFHPYTAVDSVELHCTIDREGDTQSGSTVVLPGGLRRWLMNERRLGDMPDGLVAVDEKLREAGVKFLFRVPEESVSDAGLIERACVVLLSEDMDEAAREKVERLFHLDEWFERRWRARTRPPPPEVSLR